MSFSAPKFTNIGKALQAEAVGGATLTFTKIQMGDGVLGSSAISSLTALKNPIATININNIKTSNNFATISGSFSNSGLSSGFYWREIGLFAADPDYPNDRTKDVLYCYQNAGDLAEYIASAASEIIEKVIRIVAIIGDASSVSALIDSSLVFVTQTELQNLTKEIFVTIEASNWTGSGHGTNTISVPGITDKDRPRIILVHSDDEATILLELKAWNLIDYYDTSTNEITFTCITSVPTQDLNIVIKGI